MNLHGIVSGAIGSINPLVTAQISQSAGYTTGANGKQVPAYADSVTALIQKQELSFKDLQHVEGLNIQGIFCTVYLNGSIWGVERGALKGGDLFAINAQTWLVVAVPEQWPDWCHAILCLQVTAQ